MKSISTEYVTNEESNQRQPAELYHIWFDSLEINKEWFYTSGDEPIVYGEHVIEKTGVELTITSYDVDTWQVYTTIGTPFIIALVKALYTKYIEPYDIDWAEKTEHIYGMKYWINQVDEGLISYSDLEQYFKDSVNENWDEMFPDIIDPWTTPYDPLTGIVATENYYGVSLEVSGFTTATNNVDYPVHTVLDSGAGILVLKSELTLTPEVSTSSTSSTVKTTSDIVYLPAILQRGDVSYSSELDVQTLKITASYLNEISLKYIAINPVSLLWISVMKIHKTQTPIETDVMFLGQIKDVSFKGSVASISCVGFSHFLKMTIPVWRYQLTCNHRLFDSYCGINKESKKVIGTISLDNVIITAAVLGTFSNNYFTGGEVIFGSESRKIVSHAGTSVTIAYKFAELKTGDTVRFYPGCDGRIETCRDIFDNILNYLGFPFIPLEVENPAIRTTIKSVVEQPEPSVTVRTNPNAGWNDPDSDNYWGGGP